MKCQVNATVSEYRKVYIDSKEILDIVKQMLDNESRDLRLQNPVDRLCISDAKYINADGYWELWENGHGSGYTTTYRKATQEEIELEDLIKKTMSILRKRLNESVN